MKLRPILFWCHLCAGVSAGVVILMMSFTGVLLMYERQILAWADSGYRSASPEPNAGRLPLERAIAQVRAAEPKLQPTSITLRSDPTAPVTIVDGRRTLFVDPYTGAVLGEASGTGLRAVMSTVREWHRWLGVSAPRRTMGRAVTGWSTAIFLGIICSGLYLWIPRRWKWQHVRAIVLFRGGLRGKSRDFNWHNVVGIWSAVPLFFVVLCALPISFPWANAAVYRAVGEQPPAPVAPAPPGNTRLVDSTTVEGLDRALVRATQQVGGWRSIAVRLPAIAGRFVFTIDRGDGGQPQLRDTVTVAASGEVVRFEPFAAQTLGRRLRSISRFAHTGEVLGLPGQTLAGIASAGAVVLVWTGLSLAWRRLFAKGKPENIDRDLQRNAA
jgi:uncharacterized iron-regulated membrane protein